MTTDLLDDTFDETDELFTVSPSLKRKKTTVEDLVDSDDDFNLDEFLGKTTKKSGKKRVHRYINIVLSERKPGGYDIYLNDNGFTCKGGRKVNPIGMETFELASREAVKLYRKIQFNPDTHKRRKYMHCDIYQEWNEVEQSPVVTSPFFAEDKAPEYVVPEWVTFKTVRKNVAIVGKPIYVKKQIRQEVYQLKYEVVDGVTRAKVSSLIKWFIKLARGKKHCVSKNGFISSNAFGTHAQLFWRNVDINQLGVWFARERNRKWSRRFANDFKNACVRLHKSIRVNLALQSFLIDKIGRPSLPLLGQIIIPAKVNRDTGKEKLVSDFHFKYESVVRPIVNDEDGNVLFYSDWIKSQQATEHFEEKWEIKEIETSSGKEKLPVFKKTVAQVMNDAMKVNLPVELEKVPVNSQFIFANRKFTCLQNDGGNLVLVRDEWYPEMLQSLGLTLISPVTKLVNCHLKVTLCE